jgi:hypothetical protein
MISMRKPIKIPFFILLAMIIPTAKRTEIFLSPTCISLFRLITTKQAIAATKAIPRTGGETYLQKVE